MNLSYDECLGRVFVGHREERQELVDDLQTDTHDYRCDEELFGKAQVLRRLGRVKVVLGFH